MRKKSIRLSVLNANPFVIFCIIFTVSIIVTVMSRILSGELHYISLIDTMDSFVICSAPIVTLVLFYRVPVLKYLSSDDCSRWISILVHYLISSGLLILSVFVMGLVMPVHADAYRNVIVAYTRGYAMVILVAIIIDVRKVAVANKNLRKIQGSKHNANKNNGGFQNEKKN